MAGSIELQEFFVEGNNPENQHVLLHITEPTDLQEKEKGYFFAVCETKNIPISDIRKLQTIISEIENQYYKAENEENSFENALKYINETAQFNFENKDKINLLSGVAKNNDVFFSYCNKPHALLLYELNKNLRSKKIINNDEVKNNDEKKLFSNIFEGKLSNGSFLYLTTQGSQNVFSDDRILKLFSSRPFKNAVNHIQKVLSALQDGLSYGGIILYYPKPESSEKPIRKVEAENSVNSIKNLLNAQKNAQETLTPTLIADSKNKIKELFSKEKNKKEQFHENTYENSNPYKKQTMTDTILIGTGRTIVFTLTMLLFLLKKIIFGFYFFAKNIFFIIFYKQKRDEIKQSIKNNISQKKALIYEMSLTRKVILSLIFLLTIFLFSSVGYLKIKKNAQMEQFAYENKIKSIVEMKTTADSSIIYGNDKRAYEIINEAKNEIANLPEKNQEQKDKKNELFSDTEQILLKLRKIKTITPDLLFDIKQTNSEAKTSKLAILEKNLIAYGENDKNFYKLNITTKDLITQTHENYNELYSNSTPKENDKIVFINNNNAIYEYSKETPTLSPKEISYPSEQTKITSIFVYNQKLYTLDATNNQIYKHNKTQTGYDKGQKWIKENIELNSAISFTIDSDVYVLNGNGIIKITKGIKQFFETNIDPALNNPNKIWTYGDVKNIYILEPSGKRIIVLDKNGVVLTQYTAKEWTNPMDMIVDFDNNTIYVLDDNKIYSFREE